MRPAYSIRMENVLLLADKKGPHKRPFLVGFVSVTSWLPLVSADQIVVETSHEVGGCCFALAGYDGLACVGDPFCVLQPVPD